MSFNLKNRSFLSLRDFTAQEIVETLAQWAGMPVYNGLTDAFHPTQILADVLTTSEHVAKTLNQIAFCFRGDAGNNMGDSLLIGPASLVFDQAENPMHNVKAVPVATQGS